MQTLKRYIIITIIASITGIGLSYTFQHYFTIELHKEALAFKKDKYIISHLTDLYMLACSDKKYQKDKECVILSKEIEVTYLRVNNDYKFVNFYLQYIN
ncbi:MAG: hypothetical protein KAQ94_03915 [Arcobacteraceae bacterium]|nr:hypothetical protein [Arcobacteraceae bacterium]